MVEKSACRAFYDRMKDKQIVLAVSLFVYGNRIVISIVKILFRNGGSNDRNEK